jgi:hypothetical protein
MIEEMIEEVGLLAVILHRPSKQFLETTLPVALDALLEGKEGVSRDLGLHVYPEDAEDYGRCIAVDEVTLNAIREIEGTPIGEPCWRPSVRSWSEYRRRPDLFRIAVGAYGSSVAFAWATNFGDAIEVAIDALHESGWRGYVVLEEEDFDGETGEAADMYVIGHTTFPEAEGIPAIPSWELHGGEVLSDEIFIAVTALSIIDCEDDSDRLICWPHEKDDIG